MAHQELDSADFETFTAICKGLPGVKPRKTQQRLRELHYQGENTVIGGVPVSADDLKELFVEAVRGGFLTERVSPAGARLLVKLYEAGALEVTPSTVSDEVRAYCESEVELREKVKARERAAAELKERREHPERIKEEDFSYSLLNQLFWHHGQQGNSSMVVGGITVHKTVLPRRSNSGKSTDFAVTFSWTGADGKQHQVEKANVYDNNRRNDPDRNWGLPPRG